MLNVDTQQLRTITPVPHRKVETSRVEGFTVHATTTTTRSQAVVFGSKTVLDHRPSGHKTSPPPEQPEQALQGIDAEDARAVFDEDVNAFVEDQLRLACQLALAE